MAEDASEIPQLVSHEQATIAKNIDLTQSLATGKISPEDAARKLTSDELEKDKKISKLEDLLTYDEKVPEAFTLRGFKKQVIESIKRTIRRAAYKNQNKPESSPSQSVPTYSLFKFDLDRFKEVNDTYGHDDNGGDGILGLVGKLYWENLRETDYLVRNSGDEFFLVIQADAKNAQAVIERFQKALTDKSSEFLASKVKLKTAVDHPTPVVTLSGGFTNFDPNTSLENQLLDAEYAVYQSKKNGRDRVTVFDPSMRPDSTSKHTEPS